MKLHEGEILRGIAGTATEILRQGKPDQPDWEATIAMWFLNCPGQSAAWDHYLLSIIHLRDIKDVPPAHIRVPGATHEVLLVALDPGQYPSPTKVDSWTMLRPINVEEQIHLPDDERAKELLHMSALAVVTGLLPAEPALSGAVEPWRTTLIRTSAHLRGEEHAP